MGEGLGYRLVCRLEHILLARINIAAALLCCWSRDDPVARLQLRPPAHRLDRVELVVRIGLHNGDSANVRHAHFAPDAMLWSVPWIIRRKPLDRLNNNRLLAKP